MKKSIILSLLLAVIIHFGVAPAGAQRKELKPTVSYGFFMGVSVKFSPDGKTLFGGGIVWDVKTGRPMREIEGFNLSPDGETIADCSEETEEDLIAFCDMRTGHRKLTIKERIVATAISFSPDGKSIAFGEPGEKIQLRDGKTGKLLKSFKLTHRHAEPNLYSILNLVFSPDSKTLAVSTFRPLAPAKETDRTVELWDVATGKRVSTLSGNAGSIEDLEFSPDGKFLAASDEEGKIIIWDTQTNKATKTLSVDNQSVQSVSFSPDGKFLVSGHHITTGDALHIWDLQTGKMKKALSFSNGQQSSVYDAAYSPDGKIIAAIGDNKRISFWDAQTGKLLRQMTERRQLIRSVELSPETGSLFVNSYEAVNAIRINPETKLENLSINRGSVQLPTPLALSPNGKILAVYYPDEEFGGREKIVFYDSVTLKRIKEIDPEDFISSVVEMRFTDDGERLILFRTGEMNENILFLNPISGKIENKFRTISEMSDCQIIGMNTFAVSHKEKKMIVPGDKNEIAVWDLESGKQIATFRENFSCVIAMAISPDGQTLVSGSQAGEVILWSLATGKKQFRLEKNNVKNNCSIVFSPDGEKFATPDGFSFQVWETKTGRQLKNVRRENWMKFSCETQKTFSVNGKLIVAETDNYEIKLSDAVTEKLLATITLIYESDWVAIAPDGTFEGSDEGLMEIYLTDGERVVEIEAKKHKSYRPGLLREVLFQN